MRNIRGVTTPLTARYAKVRIAFAAPLLIAAVVSCMLVSTADSADSAPAPLPSTPLSSGGANNAVEVHLTGASLTGISSSPLALDPRFNRSDTDYVWYCIAGTNTITLTLSSDKGTISFNGQSGPSVSAQVAVTSNQAVVVIAPNSVQYWIRCLPVGFPQFSVKRYGNPAPGYFISDTFGNSNSPGYPLIFNRYGTPIWYLTGVPDSAQNASLVPGTHTLSWDQNPYYILYNLDTKSFSTTQAPVAGYDEHELFYDTQGNAWMLSKPLLSGYNLSDIGFPNVTNILDCVIQEVNPAGQLVWEWRASQYVNPDESNNTVGLTTQNGQTAADVYHCNSIDVDPENQDHILVSMRGVGVLLIDKSTGSIIWKLGGTSVPPMDGEPVLSILGDPEGTIVGQHDARFQPNGDVSLFDDHTKALGAARGVEYAINTSASTATMLWEYPAPSGDNSRSMGSMRMYDANTMPYDETGTNYLGAQETVINWGHGAPSGGFTVLNTDSNQVLLQVRYIHKIGYRTEEVPLTALDLTELRDTAGTAL